MNHRWSWNFYFQRLRGVYKRGRGRVLKPGRRSIKRLGLDLPSDLDERLCSSPEAPQIKSGQGELIDKQYCFVMVAYFMKSLRFLFFFFTSRVFFVEFHCEGWNDFFFRVIWRGKKKIGFGKSWKFTSIFCMLVEKQNAENTLKRKKRGSSFSGWEISNFLFLFYEPTRWEMS